MIRPAAIALLLSLALPCGLAAQGSGVDIHRLPLGHPLYKFDLRLLDKGKIYSAELDRTLTFEGLIARLARHRVILLGESHDNLAHHRFQARVVAALARLKQPLVLGMEFFQAGRDDDALDAYAAGRQDLRSTLVAVDWKAFNYRYYAPILEAARKGGATIRGVNIPRSVVRTVSRKGLGALSPEQRALFPPVDVTHPEHRYLIRTIFGRTAVANRGFFERFYAAQSVWDTAMAANTLAALDAAGPESRAVIIVGNGHVYYDLCISRRLRELRPDLPVASLVQLPVTTRKPAMGMMGGKARPPHTKRAKPGAKGPAKAHPKTPASGRQPTTPKAHPKAPAANRSQAMPKGKPKAQGKGKAAPPRTASSHPAMGSVARGRIFARTLAEYVVGTAPSTAGGDYPKEPFRLAKAKDEDHLVVSSISRTSPLYKAGLRKGDAVLTVDGVPVAGAAAVRIHLMDKKWGDPVEVTVKRKEEEHKFTATLARPGKPKKPAGKPAGKPGPKPTTPPAPKKPRTRPHHRLRVQLDPATHGVTWTDRLVLPARVLAATRGRLDLRTAPGLELGVQSVPGADLVRQGPGRWQLQLASPFTGPRTVELTGGATYDRAPALVGQDHARGFKTTDGTIGPQGVFLTGASGWVPAIVDWPLFTFDLEVTAPAGWQVITQGRRLPRQADRAGVTRFLATGPQEEVYLVGGPLTRRAGRSGKVTTEIYLRRDDAALAGRYLAATDLYLRTYTEMLGPYPWAKFATVENFWETGYGMPSFTLLGPRVLRFPWILHTSFPHEILHNWWGNGVYVDFAKGNWCEGITAYLADHLQKEQRAEGAAYRRYALERFTNYVVDPSKDFPLSAFRSRHSPATEAVGYGKSLFLYHMLRRQLGNEPFVKGLRRFYRDNLHRRASWDDVRKAFEEESGQDLRAYFDQWTGRAGAPRIALDGTAVTPKAEGGFEFEVRVRQTQAEAPFALTLPLAIHMEECDRAQIHRLRFQGRTGSLRIHCPTRPLRVELDPRFDVFRRLHPGEVPPSLSAVLGSARTLVVLPGAVGPELLKAYLNLARVLISGRGQEVRVIRDNDPQLAARVQESHSLWIMDAANTLVHYVDEGLNRCGARRATHRVTLGGSPTPHDLKTRHLVAALPHPTKKGRAIGFIHLASAQAGPPLARKLAHYGKYGYLVFEGDGARNTAKGRHKWEESPMHRLLPGSSDHPAALPLPADRPLWFIRRAASPGGHPGGHPAGVRKGHPGGHPGGKPMGRPGGHPGGKPPGHSGSHPGSTRRRL